MKASLPYMVVPYKGGFRLRGDKPLDTVFTTVHAAKSTCWRLHHAIPVRVYSDERPFDGSNPLHRALSSIEAQHCSSSLIVGVGSTHYLIRRSRFGIEVPITYKVHGAMVHARSQSVFVEPVKSVESSE